MKRWLARRGGAASAHPPLDARPALGFVAIDCETTGMDPRNDGVVALAAVRCGPGGTEEAYFETLVDPGRPISEASLSVHGISEDMIQGAPVLSAALPAFRDFVGAAIPVAHMGAFDLAFLQRPLARARLPKLERMLDTAVLAARLLRLLPVISLETACASLGIPVVGRHTALGDARLTAALFARFVPLLERRDAHTLAAALHWGEVSRAALDAPTTI
jgi:DNA polymerase-3 subunit epsilon